MFRKLIAPRIPCSTRCDFPSHWSDFSRVLHHSSVSIPMKNQELSKCYIQFAQNDPTSVLNHVITIFVPQNHTASNLHIIPLPSYQGARFSSRLRKCRQVVDRGEDVQFLEGCFAEEDHLTRRARIGMSATNLGRMGEGYKLPDLSTRLRFVFTISSGTKRVSRKIRNPP